MKRFLFWFVLAAVALGGGYAAFRTYGSSGPATNFRTATVSRTTLSVTVGATGTLEPEDLVDVGAQVIGRVKELGKDARGATEERYAGKDVDYGSLVTEGQVLALIDDSVYRAQRDQAKAALERSKADLLQLQAKLAQTDAEWTRAQKLRTVKIASPTGRQSGGSSVEIRGIADADYVLAKSNRDAAAASVEVGKAAIDQEKASLELAETNLSYTTILSPVTGTVIDRRVNIGQTVVSSLNAPSLFLIAKDLRRMQVWASVNEADIGMIKLDMPVRFTVDAFPDDVFEGKVVQIRLNASMTQNVVTYTVVVENDNSDLKLLPYLTADVEFIVDEHVDVLAVPNAALRYEPRDELIAPGVEIPSVASESEGVIWIRDGETVAPVVVTVGATDGSSTVVSSASLAEGAAVVLGETQATSSEEVVNPFAPPRIPRQQKETAPNP